MSATLSSGPAEFLLELGSAPIAVTFRPAPWGMGGAYPPGALPVDYPAASSGGGTVVRLSQRGWTGEPGDSARPNLAYPPRIKTAPSLALSIPILPEDTARGTASAAETTLDNADGRLDTVVGDWSMQGQPATLLRGPHRTPRRADSAEFVTVASLRVASPAIGTTVPRIELEPASADLSLPVCATYAGAGGIEGDAARAGQNRPLLLGTMFNLAPVQMLAVPLVYQISSAPLGAITGVRDKGADLPKGSDYPTLTALLNGKPADGTYDSCMAQGLIRLASTPQGIVTCDAQSDGDVTHGGIALSLLRGPGGLTTDRILAGTVANLPSGVAGFLFSAGTVAEAVSRVMRSCAGWWGDDRLGRTRFGRLPVPERAQASRAIPRWVIQKAIDDFGGAVQDTTTNRPRWGQRARFQILGVTQAKTDLIPMGAAEADYFATGYLMEPLYDTAILSQFPAALNPEPLDTGWRDGADAQALLRYLLDLHGKRRRQWDVPVGALGHLLDVGQVVTADYPRLAGQNWVVTSISGSGDNMRAGFWG